MISKLYDFEIESIGFCPQYIETRALICVLDRFNEEYKIIFVHEPKKKKKKFIYDNDIHLFGHIHEKQMIKRFGLNVGIDCHNFNSP